MPFPDAAWFERDPVEVAPLLLGGILRREDAEGAVALRLTEVEAYRGGDDPGAHSFRGRTERNATMFGPGGHVYCYFTYGMHHAVNLVAGPEGSGWGILVRAGEVVEGVELARARRAARRATAPPVELARGPGNVAQALGATLADDGAALAARIPSAELHNSRRSRVDSTQSCTTLRGTWTFVLAREYADDVRSGPRVGVSGEGGDGARFPWRFWLPGEPSVSAYRAAKPRIR